MAIQNQGFRQDLNFQENTEDTPALNNLYAVGIADDLRVMQNNLRNTSSIDFVSFNANNVNFPDTTGFFTFPDRDFVFTKDDVVGVSKTVSVGSTSLQPGVDYFVTDSNAETQFKLSFYDSANVVGIETVIVDSVSPTDFSFIRKDPVYRENIDQFKQPDIQDNENFGSYLNGAINGTFDDTQNNIENAGYFVTKKYKGTENTTTDENIKFEGTINLFDPDGFNNSLAALNDAKSPGIFIGNTRAFSSDNNPWTVSGTELKTDSTSVSIGELFFADEITIDGISQVSATAVDVTSFTEKIPVVINGETYYLLLSP